MLHISALLEAYLLALHDNPMAVAPPELDMELAEFARRLVNSQRVPKASLNAKSLIWHYALENTRPTSSHPNHEEKLPMSSATQVLPLKIARFRFSLPLMAAMVTLALMGVFLLAQFTPNSNNKPVHSGSGFAQQATDTPTAAPPIPATPTLSPMAVTISPSANEELRLLDMSKVMPVYQTWNNGGPAVLEMTLQYLGADPNYDQAFIRAMTSPHPDDKTALPWELVDFVNSRELLVENSTEEIVAYDRIGGTLDILMRLVDANIPVIAQIGFEVVDNGWFGQYVLVLGYNEKTEEILYYNPMGNRSADYPGIFASFSDFEEVWTQMNRSFIVVTLQKGEHSLNSAWEDYANPAFGYEKAYLQATQAIETDETNSWAWFNRGEAVAAQGDFEEAGKAFDSALALELPPRLLWYRQSPLEVYYQLKRYDTLIMLLDDFEKSVTNVDPTSYTEVIWHYQGLLAMADADWATATEDFERAISLNPNFKPSEEALRVAKANQGIYEWPTGQIQIGQVFDYDGCISRLDLGSMPIGNPVANVEAIDQATGGVGFVTEAGREVIVQGDGTVVFAGWKQDGLGNTIVIAHMTPEGNYLTTYAHLSEVAVRCNQRVEKGDVIGNVGNTGRSEEPMLLYLIENADIKYGPTP